MFKGQAPVRGARLHVQLWAAELDLTLGEAEEILERLPFGERSGEELPEAWQRPVARHALDVYAARKRALTHLARRGRL